LSVARAKFILAPLLSPFYSYYPEKFYDLHMELTMPAIYVDLGVVALAAFNCRPRVSFSPFSQLGA